MSKKKFKRTICHKCRVCEGNPNPKFCYKVLYKNNPKAFMDELLPDILHDPSIWTFIQELDKDDFKTILCAIINCSRCKKDDKAINSCMNKFKNQVENGRRYTKSGNGGIRATYKKSKKKKEKEIAYAAVMISDNEKFKERVRDILGNNNKQSNNN
jgi:hypothetical protein